MPVVPCMRPSQGSLQYAANGIAPAARSVSATPRTSSPISQCPVWYPSATGVPSAARSPPWVLTMTYWGPWSESGLQPMPTFCVNPNRLPLGSSRSMSGVRGSLPVGPSPASRPAATAPAVPSTASSGGASTLAFMCTTLPQGHQQREQHRRHHAGDADGREHGSPRLERLDLGHSSHLRKQPEAAVIHPASDERSAGDGGRDIHGVKGKMALARRQHGGEHRGGGNH